MSVLSKFFKYKYTCFWLFVPIIIFNIIFFQRLPSHYLRDISHYVVIIETITRILTIVFSLIMIIHLKEKIEKIGLILYIIGAFIYFLSYFAVIIFGNTLFGKNIIVVLAPYWTSVLWLIGIGLLGNKLFIKIPYHYSFYIILSIVFGIIHTYHGYICYTIE